jgi:hypothetical protein
MYSKENQLKNNRKYKNELVLSGSEKFRSKLERSVYHQLLWRKKAKEFKEIFREFPVDYRINGHKIARNYIDFLAIKPDGTKVFIEAKGAETPRYRILKQLAIAMLKTIYPGCEYWLVKGSYNNPVWKEIKLKNNI